MKKVRDYYPKCPEVMIITLARSGDEDAFAEVVRRRQSSIRNLMRRLSRDVVLADDLAQQVFTQVWLKIRTLKAINAFNGWIKKIAVSIWLQHQRKNDALHQAEALSDNDLSNRQTPAEGMDLNKALTSLANLERLCVIFSYQEGMSHSEISEVMDLPLGTTKSHIKRGTEKLQTLLSDYNVKEKAIVKEKVKKEKQSD